MSNLTLIQIQTFDVQTHLRGLAKVLKEREECLQKFRNTHDINKTEEEHQNDIKHAEYMFACAKARESEAKIIFMLMGIL